MTSLGRSFVVGLLVACAWPVAPAVAQAAVPIVVPVDFKARADALLAEAFAADEPGATVIVTRGGKTIYTGARGLADVAGKTPLTPDSVIRLGSITKQFSAAVLLQLVDEGKVSLDDPLTRYLPGYPDPGGGATVRQLLNHTSGIQSYTGIPGWMVEANTARRFTTDQLIAEFRDKPAQFKPGERWAYNNSGYVLVGAIIEKVTGKPWYVAVNERLAGPLGLASIRYGGDAPGPRWARPYTQGAAPAQTIDMSVPHAAGALVGSVGDLARWSDALHHGRVLKPETYARMIAPTTLADGKVQNYGFGIGTGTVRGARTIEHSGGIFGGNTDAMYLPDQDIFVAVFANTDSPRTAPGTLMRRLAALAIGKSYPGFTEAKVDPATLEPLFGVYRDGEGRERRFFARDGALYLQSGGGAARRAVAAGDDRFFFGPGRLDWFRIVRGADAGAEPVLELFANGEEPAQTATRGGPIPPEAPAVDVPRATLAGYVGSYALPIGEAKVALGEDGRLTVQLAGQPAFPLEATSSTEFRTVGVDARVRLDGTTLTIVQNGREISGARKP